MAKKLVLAFLIGCLILSSGQLAQANEEGWISLFDGRSFKGWKVNENKDSFSIRDGMIVVNGNRSHLFYVGPVENHNFKNFELKVDVIGFQVDGSAIFRERRRRITHALVQLGQANVRLSGRGARSGCILKGFNSLLQAAKLLVSTGNIAVDIR